MTRLSTPSSLIIHCATMRFLVRNAQSRQREAEIALRTSLGASRKRIVQQLLTEGLALALAAGALGTSLAFISVIGIRRFPLASIPEFDKIAIDHSVLLFTILLTALTGLLFGSLPAIRLSGTNLLNPLKSGSRSSAGGKRSNLRSILVVSEVAFALILLTGSSLVLKSFWHLLQVNTGFNPDNVVTANIDLPTIKYQKPYQQVQFADSLIDRLVNQPDVRQAAISSGLPFKDAPDAGIRIDGRPLGANDSGTTANYYRDTPQYFRSMEIPLIKGRLFTQQDTANSLPVAIINETMASAFSLPRAPSGNASTSQDQRTSARLSGSSAMLNRKD